MNITNVFKKLQKRLRTPIITADGEKVILFHDKPITDEEKKELQKWTSDELKVFLKVEFKFKGYKLN